MKLEDVCLNGVETILLDRDGVINRLRPNDYVKSWEEFEFLPDVIDALAEFAKKAKYIFIVTNQRGVGRGLMSEETLISIHNKMMEEIESHGGRIDGIYYCTAVDSDDHFRKPNTGMWERIIKDHPEVSSETTIMIGDSSSDMEFAKNCNVRGIRITN